MSQIMKRSVTEYRRQIGAQEAFLIQTRRITELFPPIENSAANVNFARDERQQKLLLLLMPLFEIAWADGKINVSEQNAILQIADCYELIDDAASYQQITNRLGSRPLQKDCEQFWSEINVLCLGLNESECSRVLFCLAAQAEFIAGQSQSWLLGYWRGRRAGESEQNAVRALAARLEQIKIAREELTRAALYESAEQTSAINEDENLTRIVPLVKVAWADGQVTRRERQFVLEIAGRTGIKPQTEAFGRLESWLEQHPTDEFYDSSLEKLREHLHKLRPNERDQQKFDLLADCVNVAAVSGGSRKFAGAGARVGTGEIAAVNRIAKKLSANKDAGLS